MEFKTRINKKKYYGKRISIGFGIFLVIIILSFEIFSHIFLSNFEELDPNAEIQRVGGEFYENKGDKMYYADYKKDTPNTLLLIHGSGGSSFSWNKNISDLSQSNHVITIDLLGFGLSKILSSKDIGLDRDVEIISSFIQDKKLTNLTIVATDIGGIVAQKLALHDLKNISSLVLINSLDASVPKSINLNSPEVFFIKNPIGFLNDQFFISSYVHSSFYDQTQIDKLTLEGYQKGFRYKNSWNEQLQFANSSLPQKEDVTQIKQLTLIYSSPEDKIINPNISKDLSKEISDTTNISVTKIGHLMMQEQPKMINEGIQKWLDSIKTKTNQA